MIDAASSDDTSAMMERCVASLVDLANDNAWQQTHSDHNVTISQRPPTSLAPAAFKGVGIVDAPLSCIVTLVADTAHKRRYDEIFDAHSAVDVIDTFTHIERHSYWSPARLIVTPRDFCLIGHVARLKDGTVVVAARSIDHAQCLPKRGYVRGHITVGGWIIRPIVESVDQSASADAIDGIISASRCRVTFIAQCDLRGAIPTVFSNQLFRRQPMLVHCIRKVLAKSPFNLRPDDERDQYIAMKLYQHILLTAEEE